MKRGKIVAIVVAVVVISAIIAIVQNNTITGKVTGNLLSSQVVNSCSETDNGYDVYQSGTVTYDKEPVCVGFPPMQFCLGGGTFTTSDICMGDGLMEYACEGAYLNTYSVTCDDGCVAGACKKTCVDALSGEYQAFGSYEENYNFGELSCCGDDEGEYLKTSFDGVKACCASENNIIDNTGTCIPTNILMMTVQGKYLSMTLAYNNENDIECFEPELMTYDSEKQVFKGATSLASEKYTVNIKNGDYVLDSFTFDFIELQEGFFKDPGEECFDDQGDYDEDLEGCDFDSRPLEFINIPCYGTMDSIVITDGINNFCENINLAGKCQ